MGPCAHPVVISTDRCLLIKLQEEFVPQWPTANSSVLHGRRKGQCGTNS